MGASFSCCNMLIVLWGLLRHMGMVYVSDVSEKFAASIFRFEITKEREMRVLRRCEL